jgi:DNA-binding MarR family transcriptional regulator
MADEDPITLMERQAEEIEARIQPARDAIKQDEEQVRRLREAIRVLRGNSVALAPVRRRSGSTIDEHAIVAFVGANQPASAKDIGESVGASGNSLSVKLGRMVKAGVLTKQGERRATRYSLP